MKRKSEPGDISDPPLKTQKGKPKKRFPDRLNESTGQQTPKKPKSSTPRKTSGGLLKLPMELKVEILKKESESYNEGVDSLEKNDTSERQHSNWHTVGESENRIGYVSV